MLHQDFFSPVNPMCWTNKFKQHLDPILLLPGQGGADCYRSMKYLFLPAGKLSAGVCALENGRCTVLGRDYKT